jgi:hypothetical protein
VAAHVATSVSGGKSTRRNCSSQQGRDSQRNKIAFHLNNSIWLTPYSLDKRIGRLRHLNSHVIAPADLCARGRDHHHTIEESAFKDEERSLSDQHYDLLIPRNLLP